jgi:hypothetical protein
MLAYLRRWANIDGEYGVTITQNTSYFMRSSKMCSLSHPSFTASHNNVPLASIQAHLITQ